MPSFMARPRAELNSSIWRDLTTTTTSLLRRDLTAITTLLSAPIHDSYQFLVDRAADKGLKDLTGRTAYEVSLFVGAKQLNELLKPHLVQDNPNVLEVAQEFSAVYCDSCHRVNVL